MSKFTFQETCTTTPTYNIEADTFEDALAIYKEHHMNPDEEEVQESALTKIWGPDDKLIPIPEGM